MAARTGVLLASLALIGGLLFLTLRVMVEDGVTLLVVTSLGILLLLGFGVIGALGSRPDD